MSQIKMIATLGLVFLALYGFQNCAPSSQINSSGSVAAASDAPTDPNPDYPVTPVGCDPNAPFVVYKDPDQNMIFTEDDYVGPIYLYTVAQSFKSTDVQFHIFGEVTNPVLVVEPQAESGSYVCKKYINGASNVSYVDFTRISGLFYDQTVSIQCRFSSITNFSSFTINNSTGVPKNVGTTTFVIRRGC